LCPAEQKTTLGHYDGMKFRHRPVLQLRYDLYHPTAGIRSRQMENDMLLLLAADCGHAAPANGGPTAARANLAAAVGSDVVAK
jgi:hypothetical protein